MAVLDHQPTNRNYLSKINFRFAIKKLPHVNFFCQSAQIPGFSIASADEGTPFVKIPFSGEHIEYQPLTISFLVDEDMKNYMEIYNWMRGLAFPDSYDQYKVLFEKPKYTGEGIKSEMSVFVLTAAKNPQYNVVFSDAFPVALSGIDFSSASTDVDYAVCTATFKYTSFEIIRA